MKQLLKVPSSCYGHLQRWLLLLVIIFSFQFLGVAPAQATGVDSIPDPSADTWVIDQAEVLSRLSEGKISGALKDLAKKTGQEVRMVTIHRLDYDETADTFAAALFKQWFPSTEAQANQVLLVLDNVTNSSAIRVGAEAAERLTDEIAQSVAQETLLVPLQQGDKYNQAMVAASDRLVAVLSGQPDPGPPKVVDNIQTEGTFATPEETRESNAMVWVLGLLVAATVIPMATYYFYLYMQSQ